jgi:ribA/ribD-fused uncharacterized protein
MKTIKFYRVDDEYGYFSNFAPYPISISCELWSTVEHYFQASKFLDYEITRKIKSIKSPMKAAEEGRNPNNHLRNDWEEIKERVMKQALTAKFLQHHLLKVQLLETGDAKIVEHTVNDNYWGDGGDGTGQNRLGELLMEVREEIKQISIDPNVVLPPWIAFPEIDPMDMFWRMGIGEEYLDMLQNYLENLPYKKAYEMKFPVPNEWEGF